MTSNCCHLAACKRDSINIRLKYDDPTVLHKHFSNKSDSITIVSNTEIDEYFYLVASKKIFGKVFVRGVSEYSVVSGWINLHNEQLYVMVVNNSTIDINLYKIPRKNDKYVVMKGVPDLYPVVNMNIRTGWVAIRYTDGNCYWIPPEVQCALYTECSG